MNKIDIPLVMEFMHQTNFGTFYILFTTFTIGDFGFEILMYLYQNIGIASNNISREEGYISQI